MEIRKTYTLPYPVSRVFSAWVSSDTVIPPATRMDILPEVGGHYRLIMETPDFTGKNEGSFSIVEENRRLVYTWEWNGDGEVTTIDVSFTETDGGTQVDLVHTGFSKEQSVADHDTGWDNYIEGYTNFLATQE